MHALADNEVLELWERGLARHPIDRALLLCARARPDLATSEIPDLPLGTLNRALLHFREMHFGTRVSACLTCENCGENMEVNFDTRQLFDEVDKSVNNQEFNIEDTRFRLPCRDRKSVV